MAVKVVDASALAAMLFGEPTAAVIGAQLEGARLVAPALLGFEIANVCLTKVSRHPAQRAALRAAIDLFERMAIDIVAIDHRAAVATAEGLGLTSYNASYLWLAQQLGAELVTLDRKLAAAAAPQP